MNQRIRELAEQAGFFPDWNYDRTKWHAAGYDKDFEKFAELIVRECALSVSHIQTARIHTGESVNPSQMIREHFGIKE